MALSVVSLSTTPSVSFSVTFLLPSFFVSSSSVSASSSFSSFFSFSSTASSVVFTICSASSIGTGTPWSAGFSSASTPGMTCSSTNILPSSFCILRRVPRTDGSNPAGPQAYKFGEAIDPGPVRAVLAFWQSRERGSSDTLAGTKVERMSGYYSAE